MLPFLLLLRCDISKGNVVVSGAEAGCYSSDGKVIKGPATPIYVVGSTTDYVIRAYDTETEITVENVNITHNITSPFVADASNVTLIVKTHATLQHISPSSSSPENCSENWWVCGFAVGVGCNNGSRLTILGEDGATLEAHTSRDVGIGPGGNSLRCESLTIRGISVNATGYAGAGVGGGYSATVGKLEIDDAMVNGTSILYGAGVGAGSTGDVDEFIVKNSVVSGSGLLGAGIGGGVDSHVSKFVVVNSVLNGTGRDAGAGIGGGYKGFIEEGLIDSSVVYAKGGRFGAGIGAGHEMATEMNMTIRDSKVWANGSPFTDGIGYGCNSGIDKLVLKGTYVKAKGRHGETVIQNGVNKTVGQGGISAKEIEC